jgi:hypothetical protein
VRRRASHPYAMPAENDRPIFIYRRPKLSLKDIWPQVKSFI